MVTVFNKYQLLQYLVDEETMVDCWKQVNKN